MPPSRARRRPTELFTVQELNKSYAASRYQWAAFLLLVYMALGIIYYHGIENISLVDAIYFTVVTLATVGYGDIYPHSREARIFTCFFITLGVCIIGYCLGIMSNVIVDADKQLKSRHMSRTARLLSQLDTSLHRFRNSFRAIPSLLQRSNAPTVSDTSSESSGSDSPLHNSPNDRASLVAIRELNLYSFDSAIRKLKWQVARIIAMKISLLVLGSIVMSQVEGWTGVTAVYWAIVTTTTVGYGDVTPVTSTGRIFTIVYIIVGYVLFALTFRTLVNNELRVIEQFSEGLSVEGLSRLTDNDTINRIPHMKNTSSDTISKIEFVVRILELMGKISYQDVLLASKTFDRLDSNRDGLILQSEIENELARARRREGLNKVMSMVAAEGGSRRHEEDEDTESHSRWFNGLWSSFRSSDGRNRSDSGSSYSALIGDRTAKDEAPIIDFDIESNFASNSNIGVFDIVKHDYESMEVAGGDENSEFDWSCVPRTK